MDLCPGLGHWVLNWERTALCSEDQELGQGGLWHPLRGQRWGTLPGAEPGQGLTDWDVTCALRIEGP